MIIRGTRKEQVRAYLAVPLGVCDEKSQGHLPKQWHFRSGCWLGVKYYPAAVTACDQSSNALSSPNHIYSLVFYKHGFPNPEFHLNCTVYLIHLFQISCTFKMTQNHQHESVFITKGRRGKLKQGFITHEKPFIREQRMKMITEISGYKRRRGRVWGRAYCRRSLRISIETLNKPSSILTHRRFKYWID